MSSKLTSQQEAFAWSIVFDELSQSDAYRKAYPRSQNWLPSTVHEAASRLAANSKVCARLEELKAEKEARYEAEAYRLGITPEQIIAEQAHTAFFDPATLFEPGTGRLLPILGMPAAARRALKSIKVRGIKGENGSIEHVFVAEIQMNDKLKALRDLGDHLGMYKQVQVHPWIEELRSMTDEELIEAEKQATADLERAVAERQAQEKKH